MNKIVEDFQKIYGKDPVYYDDETINDYFTELFLDINTEEELNELNDAEEYIRALFDKEYNGIEE